MTEQPMQEPVLQRGTGFFLMRSALLVFSRLLIGLIVYTFARVGVAISKQAEDFFVQDESRFTKMIWILIIPMVGGRYPRHDTDQRLPSQILPSPKYQCY